MYKKFVSIGHIVNDIEPLDHIGGGVSYTAVVALMLGYEAHIITKCPPSHPYVTALRKLGISVYILPTKSGNITTFKNFYDASGRRTQQVPQQQEAISFDDFEHFPKEILNNAIILVASVISEVEERLFPILSQYGMLAVCPQGYFRKVDRNFVVHQYLWKGFEKYITSAQVIIFSDEDISLNGKLNEELLEQFRNNVSITVLTQGEQGSTIFAKDQTFHVSAFPLQKDEIKDFTGAGDTYAATFLVQYANGKNIKHAAVTASFYAALKIMGFGGIGLDSIPDKEQIEAFVAKNPERVSAFLKENNSEGLLFK